MSVEGNEVRQDRRQGVVARAIWANRERPPAEAALIVLDAADKEDPLRDTGWVFEIVREALIEYRENREGKHTINDCADYISLVIKKTLINQEKKLFRARVRDEARKKDNNRKIVLARKRREAKRRRQQERNK